MAGLGQARHYIRCLTYFGVCQKDLARLEKKSMGNGQRSHVRDYLIIRVSKMILICSGSEDRGDGKND